KPRQYRGFGATSPEEISAAKCLEMRCSEAKATVAKFRSGLQGRMTERLLPRLEALIPPGLTEMVSTGAPLDGHGGDPPHRITAPRCAPCPTDKPCRTAFLGCFANLSKQYRLFRNREGPT